MKHEEKTMGSSRYTLERNVAASAAVSLFTLPHFPFPSSATAVKSSGKTI